MRWSERWSARVVDAWAFRGPLACALLPLAFVFGMVSGARRWMYRIGVWRPVRLGVPVIVVGNLIVGGAGKTPTVLGVVAMLQRHGYRPGIVSRGYGRRTDANLSTNSSAILNVDPNTPAEACGDEPLLLRLRSGAPVVVGRDRVAAGRALLMWHPAVDVIVSDDGLQHLALARDAQVLVFDERGGGNGWLLPAGPLREPVPHRVPPCSLVLYNAAAPSTPLPGFIARRSLGGAVALSDWWRGAPAQREVLQALRGRKITAAAGLARPQRFFEMLSLEGLNIAALPLPDHHDFAVMPWPADAADVIVTEKDAVKLDPARVGMTRVWVAALDFAPDAAFEAALLACLPKRRRQPDVNR